LVAGRNVPAGYPASTLQPGHFNDGDSTMKMRDFYAFAVRLGGLTFWVFGLFDFVYALRPIAGLSMPAKYPPKIDVMLGVIWIVLGCVLTLVADPLSKIVYRQKSLNRPADSSV
jgi:hypothetical protein